MKKLNVKLLEGEDKTVNFKTTNNNVSENQPKNTLKTTLNFSKSNERLNISKLLKIKWIAGTLHRDRTKN